jgi:hypothetical protein
MTLSSFYSENLVEGGQELDRVVRTLGKEVGAVPALGELLEVLGFSIPTRDEFFDGVSVPLRLSAKVKGGRRYIYDRKSRIAELNDAVFVESSTFFSFLAERSRLVGKHGTTNAELASWIYQAMIDSGASFEDIESGRVISLEAEMARKVIKPKRGDVVAIPGKVDSYTIAVIVTRNRFGTALGLLRGKSRFPRLPSAGRRRQLRGRVVYTDDQLIAGGTWPIVDHVDQLLSLFPEDPEIYHAPGFSWPGVELGEFGSAESSSGDMRKVDQMEAGEMGLLDGSYRQVYVSEHLQDLLDDEF